MNTTAFKDVEDALLLWFKEIRGKHVPILGPILQAKVDELAKELGHVGFNCSSGWLQRFKNCQGIGQKTICGESAAVAEETMDRWLSTNLPTLLEGYHFRDVFNADETSLFFKMLPEKTSEFKGVPCHGKDRITVLVGANINGTVNFPS